MTIAHNFIARVKAGMAASAPAPKPAEGACRNCGHPLGDPRPNYCGACGQETALKPPTVMEFIHQFGGNYVAMEGALWRSLGLLLFRPGRLTREYLDGRRRRYVLPLRLYLTVSLVTLLALGWFSGTPDGPRTDQIFKVDASDAQDSMLDIGRLHVGMTEGRVVCEGPPAAWCARLRERLTLDPQSMQRELARIPQRFVSHWGSAMFLLLPLFAVFQKLVYWNRHMRWSEHLVFALHVHAFWFAMLLTQLSGLRDLKDLAALAVPAYTLIAARVVYGGRWWTTLLRGLTVSVLYAVAVLVAMTVVGVWAFLA